MFIINANVIHDLSNCDVLSKAQTDCNEIMQLCDLPVITTHYEDERKLVESEEFTHFDIFGVVILKCKSGAETGQQDPYRPIYSMINNDAATTAMIDIFCEVLNRQSFGSHGYVSARNAWFEQYKLPRCIIVNLADCNFPNELQRELPAYGERLAIALIAFIKYLLPAGNELINSKCSAYFGERSNYLNNKYPFEL